MSVNFGDPEENREQTLHSTPLPVVVTGCPIVSPDKTLGETGHRHEKCPLCPACPPAGGRGRGPGAPEGS